MKKACLVAAMTAFTLWGQGGALGCDQLWRFNPCGTILNCDPAAWYSALFTGPNWNIDPSCPIPGQCGEDAA